MTQRAKRIIIVSAICVTSVIAVLAMYAKPVFAILKLELLSQDLRAQFGRKTSVNTNLVFLGVDQPGYPDMFGDDEIQESPALGLIATNYNSWSRKVWSAVVERLIGAGAQVVALDFMFQTPKDGDDDLKRTVQRHEAHLVLAANLTSDENRKNSFTLSTPYPDLLNVPLTAVRRDRRVGFINVWEDRDGVVRSARFQLPSDVTAPGETVRSFAARIVEKFSSSTPLPHDAVPRAIRFTAPPKAGYPVVPLYTIFLPEHWRNNYGSGTFFKGKVVVVGPAANIFQDEHLVPLSRIKISDRGEKVSENSMPGPEIHVNIVAAALAGELLRDMNPTEGAWLIAIAGFFAWLFAITIRGPMRRLVLVLAVSALFAGLCQLLYDRANLVVFAVGPLLALNASSFVVFTHDFVLERRERQKTRRTLERYVSKDVVHELLDNPQTYLNTLVGVRKPVTILFSDVRGFTTMTEGADPTKLVTQLNEYFKEMVGIVFAEHGSLDKFIGDAVMALWGSITTEGVEKDAQHAVASALAMKKALAQLNINWEQRGMKELAFGIGINHGDVIVGNLGSEEKMEVSVIGDAVNLASRLEGLTKEYKLDLLIGEAMAPLVQSRFITRTVGSVQVKGKTIPVRIFTVLGDKSAGDRPPSWLPRYEEAIQLYRTRKFAEGEEIFLECVRAAPDDHLSKLYLDECRELIAHPPGLDWNTVVIMKSK
jgi:adenylate cyclase